MRVARPRRVSSSTWIKKPRRKAGFITSSHQLSQWTAVSSGRRRALSKAPHTCGGSRRHGHLYFPGRNVGANSPGPISRPACHYTRRPVSDSLSKLVTAVTRARVDHPSFLCYSAPSQTCLPTIGSYASRVVVGCYGEPGKPGASVWDTQEKPGLATAWLESDGRKCTASRPKCHVVF